MELHSNAEHPATPRPLSIRYAGDDFFIAITPSGNAVTVDNCGDRKAAAGPMELFLIGLGCCTGTDVISILQKKRIDVSEYRLEIRNTRRVEHPRSFERIEVKHVIRGKNVDPAAVERAVELSTNKYCGAINTVRPTAEVIATFEIIEDVLAAEVV